MIEADSQVPPGRPGRKMPRKLVQLVLIICGALTYALAFPPFEIMPLAWLAPLFWLWLLRFADEHVEVGGNKRRPERQRFWLLFPVGYLGSAIVVFWLTSLFSALGILLWIIPATWFGIWGVLVGCCWRGTVLGRIVWPAVTWVAVEYLRCEIAPLAFSFGSLGSSQANILGFGLASYVGVYGLSGVMMLTAAALVNLIQNKRLVPLSAAATLILGGLLSVAWYREMHAHPGQRLLGRAALQQLAQNDDIGSWRTVPPRKSAQPIDLIVWPELTYAHDPRLPEVQWFVDLMKSDAAHARWGSIFGAVRLPAGSKSVYDRFYNTAYFMQPDGRIVNSAVKNQPVQLIADGMPADDVTVMEIGTSAEGTTISAGVGICYDGCFQRYSQRMVAKGADFLVFPTMNVEAWGPSQHRQHQRLFQMRAAETGRTVLVAAVSGPTFAAAPGGAAGDRAAFHRTETIMASILAPHATWFNRGGWIAGPFCLVLAVLGGAVAYIVSRRSRDTVTGEQT